MDTLWTAVAWVSIGLVGLSAWSLVRSFGEDRPLRSQTLLVTIGLSLAALVVYVALMPVAPSAAAWALGALGVVVGALVSRSTRLSVVGSEVTGRPSPWLALQWAALFAVAQLAALGVVFDSAASGMGALFLGTGVAVGGAAMLLWRRGVLARHAQGGTVVCPHCHDRVAPGSTRCAQCSWQVRTRGQARWAPPRAGV
jgi:hypothetical protein